MLIYSENGTISTPKSYTYNGKELNNSSKAPGLYISDFIDEAVDFLLRKGRMSRSEVDFALKSRKRELYEYIRDKIVCVD